MGDLLYPLGTLAFFAATLGYVRAIRQKIEADPARARLLLTEPGVGYRLRVQ